MPGVEEDAAESSETAGSYVLQPLKSIYFDGEVPNSLGASGNRIYLGVCAILAVVILTIAGVNYVNLATARAGRRIHEIGVRKALGAHRGQLIPPTPDGVVAAQRRRHGHRCGHRRGRRDAHALRWRIRSHPSHAVDNLCLRRSRGPGTGDRTGSRGLPGLGRSAPSAVRGGTRRLGGRCPLPPGAGGSAVHGHRRDDDHVPAHLGPGRLHPGTAPSRLGSGIPAGTGGGDREQGTDPGSGQDLQDRASPGQPHRHRGIWYHRAGKDFQGGETGQARGDGRAREDQSV